MPVTLRLLGGAALQREDGSPFTGRVVQRHRLALLALLATAPAATVGRERLLALLWPESDTDRARNLLNVAVYDLRKALGERTIVSAGDELRLDVDGIRVDALALGAALAAGDPAAAVECYGGPFMDGFHLAGSTEFAQWLDAERARYGAAYARALEELATTATAQGALGDAERWWRERSGLDPADSRVAARLVETIAASGNVAGALQQAALHERLLRAEFEIAPPKEFAAVVTRVRAAGSAAEPPAESPADGTAATTVASIADAPARSPARTPAEPELTTPPIAPAPPPHPHARRRRGMAMIGLAVLAGTAIYGIAGRRHAGATLEASAPAPAARSLAVLPFVNLSPDSANRYFSDGLSEQVIGALGRVIGLRVAARTSSFALRDAGLGVRAIGDTLAVETVLEGSVRREGERVRVTAQLVDAKTGYQLWSADFDRNASDVFAVQEEIARAIADALELRLPVRLPATSAPPNLQARDLYLRALHLRSELDLDALRQATELLDRAIELEPGFALAHAARASVIAPRMFYGDVPVDAGVRDMRGSIARAFAIDSTLGEAHVALGMLRLFFERDWAGAERPLRRALELNPNDQHAWHHLGNHLRAAGRMEESVAAFTRAVALDPLNARSRQVLATDLAAIGRMDEALAQAARAQAIDPLQPAFLGRGPNVPLMARLHDAGGRPEAALDALLQAAALRGATAAESETLRAAYARGGMRTTWRAWRELVERQSGATANPMGIALLHAASGDRESALDWLEQALAARDPGMIFVNADAMLAALRDHPRFQRIVTALGLPPA